MDYRKILNLLKPRLNPIFSDLIPAYDKNIENQGSSGGKKIKICLSPDRECQDELFLSVAGDSVAFSYVFIASLDFFGSFFHQWKK